MRTATHRFGCGPVIAAWHLAALMAAGADLNPLALRILGQVNPWANGMNLVEGRELASPQGLAVDLSSTPAHLYVSDTGNNRVLGWRDAAGFPNGQMADLVIGQPDFFSTLPNAPGVPRGLSQGTKSSLWTFGLFLCV